MRRLAATIRAFWKGGGEGDVKQPSPPPSSDVQSETLWRPQRPRARRRDRRSAPESADARSRAVRSRAQTAVREGREAESRERAARSRQAERPAPEQVERPEEGSAETLRMCRKIGESADRMIRQDTELHDAMRRAERYVDEGSHEKAADLLIHLGHSVSGK